MLKHINYSLMYAAQTCIFMCVDRWSSIAGRCIVKGHWLTSLYWNMRRFLLIWLFLFLPAKHAAENLALASATAFSPSWPAFWVTKDSKDTTGATCTLYCTLMSLTFFDTVWCLEALVLCFSVGVVNPCQAASNRVKNRKHDFKQFGPLMTWPVTINFLPGAQKACWGD